MITQLMVQLSSLIPVGMNIVPLGNVFLFHLTDDLQDRLENSSENAPEVFVHTAIRQNI
jgi:hypothetical protein